MRKIRYLVLITVVLAVVVRLWGIDYGLPQFSCEGGNETYVISHANDMLKNMDFNPHNFIYPTLYTYMLVLLFWCCNAVRHVMDLGLCSYADLFLMGRVVTALFGGLSVLLVYLIGSRFYDKKIGLVGSIFLALAYLHIRDSHFATPDVPVAFFILLSLLFIHKIMLYGRTKDYAIAGLISGLAAAVKYPALALAAPIMAAHILRDDLRAGALKQKITDVKLYLCCLFILAGFFAGCPFCLFDSFTFLKDAGWQALSIGAIGHKAPALFLRSGWVVYPQIFAYGVGFVSTTLSIIGICALLYKHEKKDLFLLSFPVSYFIIIGRLNLPLPRYSMSLLPFLALFAAFGVYVAADKMKSVRLRNAVLAVLIAAVSLECALKLTAYFKLLSETDTRIQVVEWVNGNLPLKSVISYDNNAFDIVGVDYSSFLNKDKKFELHSENILTREPLSHYINNKVDYLILSHDIYVWQVMERKWRRYLPDYEKTYLMESEEFYDSLNRDYAMIKEFRTPAYARIIDPREDIGRHSLAWPFSPVMRIYKLSDK